jgi:hypothetical protein
MHFVQGNISLNLNRPEAAVMAFRKAQLLKPDLRSYQGILLPRAVISLDLLGTDSRSPWFYTRFLTL